MYGPPSAREVRADVEDILRDVFSKLVEANRRLMPIDDVAGWLFRVARNRITDLFPKMQPDNFSARAGSDDELFQFGDLLPSPDAGPEAIFARNVLLQELARAIDELPEEQRRVFVGHELEGRSFKEMPGFEPICSKTALITASGASVVFESAPSAPSFA